MQEGVPPFDQDFRSISPLIDHQEYCEVTLLHFYADNEICNKIFNITFDKRCYKFRLADKEYYFREESRSFIPVDPESSHDIANQPTITARQFYEDLVEALDKADQRNNLRLAVIANDFARVKELLENGVTAFFESKYDVAAGTKFTDDPLILNILQFFKIIWITPSINRQDTKKINAEKFAEILLRRQDHPQGISAIQKLQNYIINDAEPNIVDAIRMAEIWMNEYSGYGSPDEDSSAASARIILGGEERSALETIFADDAFWDSEKLEKYNLAPGFEWNIAKIISGIRNISDEVNREEFSKIVARAALCDRMQDAEPSGSFKTIASASKFNTKGVSVC